VGSRLGAWVAKAPEIFSLLQTKHCKFLQKSKQHDISKPVHNARPTPTNVELSWHWLAKFRSRFVKTFFENFFFNLEPELLNLVV